MTPAAGVSKRQALRDRPRHFRNVPRAASLRGRSCQREEGDRETKAVTKQKRRRLMSGEGRGDVLLPLSRSGRRGRLGALGGVGWGEAGHPRLSCASWACWIWEGGGDWLKGNRERRRRCVVACPKVRSRGGLKRSVACRLGILGLYSPCNCWLHV